MTRPEQTIPDILSQIPETDLWAAQADQERERIATRLELLEEVSQYCSEPEIIAKRDEHRRKLNEYTNDSAA